MTFLNWGNASQSSVCQAMSGPLIVSLMGGDSHCSSLQQSRGQRLGSAPLSVKTDCKLPGLHPSAPLSACLLEPGGFDLDCTWSLSLLRARLCPDSGVCLLSLPTLLSNESFSLHLYLKYGPYNLGPANFKICILQEEHLRISYLLGQSPGGIGLHSP